MTPPGGVSVSGLNQLIRELKAAGVEIADLKVVFGEIAADAAREAARLAPRRSGRLANSIKGSRTQNKAVVRAGSARAPYAGMINYGWPDHNVPAAGFMERAEERLRPTVVPRIERELARLLREANLS